MSQQSLLRDVQYIQKKKLVQLDSDTQSISSCLHTTQRQQETHRKQHHPHHHLDASVTKSLECDDRNRLGDHKGEESNKLNGIQSGSSAQNDGCQVSMGKTASMSKLNAQAPEFIPRAGASSLSPLLGPTTPPLQQKHRLHLPRLTMSQSPNPQVYSSPRVPTQSSFSSSAPRTPSHLSPPFGAAECYDDHETSDAENTGSGCSNSSSKGAVLTEHE